MLSLDKFKKKIKRDFLDEEDKYGLFWGLESKLRDYPDYPTEYTEYFFETVSEPMPLHAAFAIKYFRRHKFFSEKLPEFERNLYQKCEQNFIREISSDSPDLEYCANLHTALSLLNSEHIEKKITQAVETISEQWKKVLFKQISICIQAVNKLETSEQSLLAPILKSFYINYSTKINCDFLLKELEQAGKQGNGLSTNRAAETALSEILRSTIKNKYFSYFKILYSLFPNWHMYQNEIEWEEFMELAFEYADSSEHLIDLLYVCLEISIGSDSLKTKTIENWHKKIISFSPENQLEKVISFIYYSVCIQADEENIQKYVSEMPKYEENKLFSEVLPAESLPIGGIFVAKNTEKILKNSPWLLKEYLEKTGKNNIYHFDTELDCPEAPPTNMDSEKAIDSLCMYCNLETTIYCYFNTHLRKIYDIVSLCIKLVSNWYYASEVNDNFGKYVFKGTAKKTGPIGPLGVSCLAVAVTSQFLCPEKFSVPFKLEDSKTELELSYYFEENSKEEIYFYLDIFGYPDYEDEGIKLLPDEVKETYEELKNLSKLPCGFKNDYITISARLDKTHFIEKNFNEIVCEIIETGRITEERIKQIKKNYGFISLLTPYNIKSFVEALEVLSKFPEQQKLLMESFRYNNNYSSSLWDKEILKKYHLIAMKLHLIACCPISPFDCMIDIKDIVDSDPAWCNWLFCVNIKGTIVYQTENKLRFVPENAVCEKIPIFVDLKWNENETIENGTVCYANIEYHPSKQMFIVTSLITEKYKKYCEELSGKLKNLDEAIKLLIKRLCTDDSLFDELKEKLEERKNITDESCTLPYHYHFNSSKYNLWMIVNDIIKKCDCKMIVKVYTDTVLGKQLSSDTWHELASEHGKREVIKYLEEQEQ